jgi:hypothetical protein
VKTSVLALLLVLAIAPGVSELAELVVHYAKYGDVADHTGDRHEESPLGVGEHGCSGTFHLGHCQSGQAASIGPAIAMTTTSIVQTPPPMPLPRSLHGLSPPAPELRPPIA